MGALVSWAKVRASVSICVRISARRVTMKYTALATRVDTMTSVTARAVRVLRLLKRSAIGRPASEVSAGLDDNTLEWRPVAHPRAYPSRPRSRHRAPAPGGHPAPGAVRRSPGHEPLRARLHHRGAA